MAVNTNRFILGKNVKVYITTEDIANGITTGSDGHVIVATGGQNFSTANGEIPCLTASIDNDCLIDSVRAMTVEGKYNVQTIDVDSQDTPLMVRTSPYWKIQFNLVDEGQKNNWRKIYESAAYGIKTGTTLHNGKENYTTQSCYRIYLDEPGKNSKTTYIGGCMTDYSCETDPRKTWTEVLTFEGCDWTATKSSFDQTARTTVR
jgi:hypothetical protein